LAAKLSKRALLAEIHAAARRSIGVPAALDSAAIAMFRLVLEEYLTLHQLRERIAEQAATLLADNPDSRRLMTVPGIGPANALTILAEAGDLRRFRHHRQFLSFCGLNLSTLQSGKSRGQSHISKYGNAACVPLCGWPRKAPCACARTVSTASSSTMFAAIHSMLICGARPTRRLRRN
jgi:transposase